MEKIFSGVAQQVETPENNLALKFRNDVHILISGTILNLIEFCFYENVIFTKISLYILRCIFLLQFNFMFD